MKFLIIIITLLVSTTALAQTWVNPYVRRDGTVVQGHMRSSPNNTVDDNYSTRGNVNPFTGSQGTQPRSYERRNSNSYDRQPSSNSYNYGYGYDRRQR